MDRAGFCKGKACVGDFAGRGDCAIQEQGRPPARRTSKAGRETPHRCGCAGEVSRIRARLADEDQRYFESRRPFPYLKSSLRQKAEPYQASREATERLRW